MQVLGNEGFGGEADQFARIVAEHLIQPAVDQDEKALVVGQRHAVAQGVDKLPQHVRRDDRALSSLRGRR
jgi:hypothetical protein